MNTKLKEVIKELNAPFVADENSAPFIYETNGYYDVIHYGTFEVYNSKTDNEECANMSLEDFVHMLKQKVLDISEYTIIKILGVG